MGSYIEEVPHLLSKPKLMCSYNFRNINREPRFDVISYFIHDFNERPLQHFKEFHFDWIALSHVSRILKLSLLCFNWYDKAIGNEILKVKIVHPIVKKIVLNTLGTNKLENMIHMPITPNMTNDGSLKNFNKRMSSSLFFFRISSPQHFRKSGDNPLCFP